jgi:hypothetical protein
MDIVAAFGLLEMLEFVGLMQSVRPWRKDYLRDVLPERRIFFYCDRVAG